MPKSNFREGDLKYALAFLPVVGFIIYGVIYLWILIAGRFGYGPLLGGVVAAVIPVLIVGGLHVDGFADVVDAVYSRADREKKLVILKDPHIGTFAVLGIVVYYLLFAVLSVVYFMNASDPTFFGTVFILSRGIAVPFALYFPLMNENGFLATVRAGSSRTVSSVIAMVLVIACAVYMAFYSSKMTIIILAAGAVCQLLLAYRCKKHFGGINGDCIGYLIQYSELVMLATAVLRMIL